MLHRVAAVALLSSAVAAPCAAFAARATTRHPAAPIRTATVRPAPRVAVSYGAPAGNLPAGHLRGATYDAVLPSGRIVTPLGTSVLTGMNASRRRAHAGRPLCHRQRRRRARGSRALADRLGRDRRVQPRGRRGRLDARRRPVSRARRKVLGRHRRAARSWRCGTHARARVGRADQRGVRARPRRQRPPDARCDARDHAARSERSRVRRSRPQLSRNDRPLAR